MANWNVNQQFTTEPGTTQPSAPVLAQNSNRKYLQVVNNGGSGIVRIKFDQNFLVEANQVDSLAFSGDPNSGGFTVTDWENNTTPSQAYNVSAGTLQTALQALGAIGSGNCTVSGSVTAGFTITFTGALANTAIPSPGLRVASTLENTTLEQSAIQTLSFSEAPTAGTFKITDWEGNSTAALQWNASTGTIESAVNALAAVNNGVSNVSAGSSTLVFTFGASPWANLPVPLLSVTDNLLTNDGTLQSEVQVLYMEPLPQQGVLSLQFDEQVTASLEFDATALQIETALEALTNIGVGNVEVSGTDFTTGFSVAFVGSLANQALPAITIFSGTYQTRTDQLHADTLVEPQKRVPDDVQMIVDIAIQGIGPAAITASVATTQVGIAPNAITAAITITTPGQAQVDDGTSIAAGDDQIYDFEVPIGAMYIISDTANVPVAITEGI